MTPYRYLLSTGKATTKAEEYIIDLFRIYLTVYPGDIPHRKDLGFDFLLTGVTKDNLETTVTSKVGELVSKIQSMLPNQKYVITISSLELISEDTVKLVIDVSGTKSEDIYINLYPE